MKTFFILLFIFLNISLHQCEFPSCKTNCSTDEQCWRDAIAYRSAELIEQLFSFSSLAVHVDTFQRSHSSEVNDTIAFIDKALEAHLLSELSSSNLTIDLFTETEQILIAFCKSLISVPIEAVDKLPPLICSSSNCSSDTMNFMVIFIITVLIASATLLTCIFQSFRTQRQAKVPSAITPSVSFVTPLLASTPSINFSSHRF